tara:strand:- start:63 stop:368 length:306 start_codon:yes stop_codon:yes gene_type:complete
MTRGQATPIVMMFSSLPRRQDNQQQSSDMTIAARGVILASCDSFWTLSSLHNVCRSGTGQAGANFISIKDEWVKTADLKPSDQSLSARPKACDSHQYMATR